MLRTGLVGLIAAAALVAAPAKDVTFHRDIEPILQQRCQDCHRPGEAAPMSLLSYQDARPWAKAIREAVVGKKMPPWFADPAHGSFANDRRMPQAEIDRIVAWVDGGAKEGNAKDAPKPRTFTAGWAMGKPDAVVEMPVEFQVPATGTVEYTYFVVPTGFTEDKWVRNVEVRAGDPRVVHHVVVEVRPPGVKFLTDVKPGEAFVPDKKPKARKPDTGEGALELEEMEVAGVYVPGGVPYYLKPGQARLIPAGSDLIFQMHYTTKGKAAVDRSRVGFQFANTPPVERVVNTLVSNRNLHIPAGAADHEVVAKVTLQADSTLLSMFPHMHVRGKAFEYRATYPNGESEILLNVPGYDFNWQVTYYLNQPKLLPKGTVLECVAKYDNSPNNRFNPDASKEVWWGDQTWEEMLVGFVDLAIPVKVDPMSLVPRAPKVAPGTTAAAGQ
jgi:mono/diheme cytochrome c family protein